MFVDGIPIHCETSTEAIAVAREAAGTAGSAASSSRPVKPDSSSYGGSSRWTEERIGQFFRSIGDNQKKLIDALLETNDGRTDEQLFQTLGLSDGRAMAGVFTGLWKNAKKIGADPKDLYQRESVTIGNRRLYEYRLSDSFRAAAKKWKP